MIHSSASFQAYRAHSHLRLTNSHKIKPPQQTSHHASSTHRCCDVRNHCVGHTSQGKATSQCFTKYCWLIRDFVARPICERISRVAEEVPASLRILLRSRPYLLLLMKLGRDRSLKQFGRLHRKTHGHCWDGKRRGGALILKRGHLLMLRYRWLIVIWIHGVEVWAKAVQLVPVTI